MDMTMADATDPIEMVTVSDENIAVEEQLSRKNGGWVISFTLTSKRQSPVATRISVPMPDEPDRQDVGFHPRHEPQTWGIRDGVLTFEDTVPAEEPLQILLGIVLVEDEDVSLSLSEPSIELSQPIESTDDEEIFAEEKPIFRSNSVGVADDADGAAPTGSPTSHDGPLDPDQSGESATAPDESDVASQPESSASADRERSLEETFDLDRLSEVSEEIHEQSTEDMINDDARSPDTESDTPEERPFGGFESTPEATEGAAVDGSTEFSSSTERSVTVDSDDDILSKLVDQLESADAEDDDVETLREYLMPESQKSMDVRMQHIQSRMDDLAAYTEALEGLIDEHGTATEFMSKMESDIDDVSTEIEAVRSETTTAETERQEIRDRLSGVESTIEEVDDDLRARLDNLYEELDSIRESIEEQENQVQNLRETVYDHAEELDTLQEHQDELDQLDDRIESTSDQLEDHRDALDQRLSTLSNQVNELQNTFEADLDSLQDEVESLTEMRSVFAQAFAEQDFEDAMDEPDEELSEDPSKDDEEAE